MISRHYPRSSLRKIFPEDAKITALLAFTSNPTSLFMALSEICCRLPPALPPRDEIKMIRRQSADGAKRIRLVAPITNMRLSGVPTRRPSSALAHIKIPHRRAPKLRRSRHPLQFEILRSRIGSQPQQDRPFTGMFQERANAILAHIGRHGNGIEGQRLEKCLGIMRGSIADITRLASAILK